MKVNQLALRSSNAEPVAVTRGHIKEKLGIKSAAELLHKAVRWVESSRAGK